MRENETVIQRLRLRGGKQHDPSLCTCIARVLGSADLHPAGMASSALLVVRSMIDPLPGRLIFSRYVLQPDVLWKGAVHEALTGLYRQAARPVLEVPPANADAVLFSDRAEFLASLTVDWLAGDLMARWWWPTLFPGADLGRVAVKAWLEAPESAPAALNHLALRNRVTEFIRALGGNDVRALLQAITYTFGLYHLHSALEENPVLMAARVGEVESGIAVEFRSSNTQMQLGAPWRRWVPESDAGGLDIDRQFLLGTGLMLQRAPAVVRSASFARSVTAWRNAFPSMATVIPRASLQIKRDGVIAAQSVGTCRVASGNDNTKLPEPSILPGEPPRSVLEGFVSLRREPMEKPVTSDAATSSGRPPIKTDEEYSTTEVSRSGDYEPIVLQAEGLRKNSVPGEQAETSHFGDTPRTTFGRISVAISEDERAMVSGTPDKAVRPECRSTPPGLQPLRKEGYRSGKDLEVISPARAEQVPAISKEQVETELGGVFYLINVALGLNLYADFTGPLEPGLALPVWDFIELVARRMLAGQFPDDPVWVFFAHLAGRDESEVPGVRFEPPDEWRIPVHWLEPFAGRSEWIWSATRKRLRVRHPEGFCILDVRVGGNAVQCLHKEMDAYKVGANFVLRRERQQWADAAVPMERWLDRLVPFLVARLRSAMGLRRRENLPNVMLKRRAHVEAGPSRLEVYLALGDLPIPVRLAGLDRDPGWVPAAGRFVAFHYI